MTDLYVQRCNRCWMPQASWVGETIRLSNMICPLCQDAEALWKIENAEFEKPTGKGRHSYPWPIPSGPTSMVGVRFGPTGYCWGRLECLERSMRGE